MSRKLRIRLPYKIIAMFGPSPCGDNGKDEVIYNCPECEERRGSRDRKGKLYVNTRSYKYHCFRCGYSGQIGRIKINSNKIYEEDLDNDLDDIIGSINSLSSTRSGFDLVIPLDKVFVSDKASTYLLERGFTEDQMSYYDLRVGNLENEFGRIVIPNQVESLVYADFYSARTYIDQTPKYKNPNKSKVDIVYNLHRIESGGPIIVVEGPLTAIAAGYHAVATYGKTMTRSQASMILKKNPSVIYLNYDFGAEEFSERACKTIYSINPHVKIMQVFMKDDRDAADLTHDQYYECLKNAVEYKPLLSDIISII